MINLSSPVTGSAQTGLTSPTYTIVADVGSGLSASLEKTYAVTTLGGTQAGVTAHSASKPFTVTFRRPAAWRNAPMPNPNTGVMAPSPRNTFSVYVRKGVLAGSGQTPQPMMLRCDIGVVAGSDIVDAAEIRAALSLLIGSLNAASAGLGDTLTSNLL